MSLPPIINLSTPVCARVKINKISKCKISKSKIKKNNTKQCVPYLKPCYIIYCLESKEKYHTDQSSAKR